MFTSSDGRDTARGHCALVLAGKRIILAFTRVAAVLCGLRNRCVNMSMQQPTTAQTYQLKTVRKTTAKMTCTSAYHHPPNVFNFCFLVVYFVLQGEAVLDVVERAWLKKADLMAEIQLQGVMSDFASAKAAINAYPGMCASAATSLVSCVDW